MQILTKQDMAEWLIRLQTKMCHGPIFKGGELKGQNIEEHFNSLSYDELHQWWETYQC